MFFNIKGTVWRTIKCSSDVESELGIPLQTTKITCGIFYREDVALRLQCMSTFFTQGKQSCFD